MGLGQNLLMSGDKGRCAEVAVESSDRRGVRDQRVDQDRADDQQRGTDGGLTTQEAAARHDRYGPNAIAEHHRNVVVELLSHFWGPIPWMIEAALILTAVTGRYLDFGIIFALLALNGGVGFWEEHQATSAIAALKQRLATQAQVKRDGAWVTVAAAELVPGDLVRVGRGRSCPPTAWSSAVTVRPTSRR